jgi:hypothetical protein
VFEIMSRKRERSVAEYPEPKAPYGKGIIMKNPQPCSYTATIEGFFTPSGRSERHFTLHASRFMMDRIIAYIRVCGKAEA